MRRVPRANRRLPAFAAAALWLLFVQVAVAQQAAPSQSADVLAGAAPEVKAALDGRGGLAARQAISTLVNRGRVPKQDLADALSKPIFAPHVNATLTALAKVDHVHGAVETFRRVASAGNEGSLVGPMFEIQVAATFGAENLRGIGSMAEGHEVDLILRDGTRVEIKYSRGIPDGGPQAGNGQSSTPTVRPSGKLSRAVAASGGAIRNSVRKAIEQLELRSKHGASPVMLVTNQPLTAEGLKRFRAKLGPASSVVIFQDGKLSTQLERGKESRGQRARRVVMGKTLSGIHRSRARLAKGVAKTSKTVRHMPKRIKAKARSLRGQVRARVRAR